MASHISTAIMTQVPSFTLNTGATIPAIGLGTWKAKAGEVQTAVSHALKSGYRHIDCALCYEVCSLLTCGSKHAVLTFRTKMRSEKR